MAMSGRELRRSLVGLEDLAGEGRDVGGGKILFAKLDEVDAIGNPATGVTEEGGLLLKLAARI
jgi:hypothetical protein